MSEETTLQETTTEGGLLNIELATQYSGLVDELFFAEGKSGLITNSDYTFDGAHSVKVYSIGDAPMHDYDRNGTGANWSRYGEVGSLTATTQTMTLTQDRSFTFAIDAMDANETKLTLEASAALARQLRQVVIPEVDSYIYQKIAANAGTSEAGELTEENIYQAIIAGTEALDDAMVPDTERCIIMPPSVYSLVKAADKVAMQTDIGQDMRLRGVVGIIDGCLVIKVPRVRLPEGCGFMICHPSATVGVNKLSSFKIHTDPPGISGALVEGRVVYDAFVLNNKRKGIYLYTNVPEA